MKKLLLLISCVFISVCAELRGQYTFSESSGVYVPLSANATLITDSINFPTWDDDWFRLGLPFQVNMYGMWYDSLGLETNGELVLYNDWTGVADPWYDVNDTVPCIMGFGEFFSAQATGDLRSRGQDASPILMEVTGFPGQQILKIEWRNAGFYEDTSSFLNNFVNFQIWIHEVSGNIEFHYGTSYVDVNSHGGSTGPTIGIATTDLTGNVWELFPGIYITGTTTSEVAGSAIGQMTGEPADSTIYFFTNLATVGIEHHHTVGFSMYPNPASSSATLMIPISESRIMITDASGRVCDEFSSQNGGRAELDLAAYNSGLYFVTVSNAEGVSTQMLIVQ